MKLINIFSIPFFLIRRRNPFSELYYREKAKVSKKSKKIEIFIHIHMHMYVASEGKYERKKKKRTSKVGGVNQLNGFYRLAHLGTSFILSHTLYVISPSNCVGVSNTIVSKKSTENERTAKNLGMDRAKYKRKWRENKKRLIVAWRGR